MGDVFDQLADLWGIWTDAVPSLVLGLVFAVLTVLWLVSSGFVFETARSRKRSPGGWALLAMFPTLVVAAIGIVFPSSFHWWAIAGLAASPLIALGLRSLVDSAATECAQGHAMAPTWVYCPVCPAPAPAAAKARPAAGVAASPGGMADGRAETVLPAGMQGPGGRPGGSATLAGRPGGGAASGPVLVLLIAEDGAASGQVTVHSPGGIIGRNPGSTVVVPDASASWEHAQVVERDGSPAVVDLGSSNGTYVNGERVETSLLIDGDRLEIGDTTFKVVRP